MRVLLFGIDGLTFQILNPLIARGVLPNFQRLRETGVQGILQSTMPPMTPPAWMSISTGLVPAEHGVYDFWEYGERQEKEGEEGKDAEKHQQRTEPGARVMTHRKGGKALWNILSDWGKQVIVANVPLTYPPEPVNGIMISGYMAPSTNANITYPTNFKDELLQAVPDYQIDLEPAISGGQLGNPLNETLIMTRKRLALFRLLLDKPWDFCYLVCSGADRIQHLRWDEIMAFQPQAIAYYRMLDEMLGTMLDMLTPEDLLMIVSDHGFQGVRRRFYIQEYLYRLGWVHMRDEGQRWRARLLGTARGAVRTLKLQQPARLLRSRLRRAGVLPVERLQHAVRLPDLDWGKTLAWIPSASGFLAGYADIFLDNSLSEDAIQTLMVALQGIYDPETGEPLCSALYREDIYGSGPFALAERHLLVLANEQTTLATELGRGALWETSDVTMGIHHPDGVLYLYGNKVKRGVAIAPSQVYDIVPTILSYMNIPQPEGLHGTIIQDAFEQPAALSSSGGSDGPVRRKLKKLKAKMQ